MSEPDRPTTPASEYVRRKLAEDPEAVRRFLIQYLTEAVIHTHSHAPEAARPHAMPPSATADRTSDPA